MGKYRAVQRSFDVNGRDDKFIRLGGTNNRVMEPGAFRTGLSKIEEDALTTGDGKIKVVESGCLWLYKTPPVISVNGRLYTNVKMSDLDNILETVK